MSKTQFDFDNNQKDLTLTDVGIQWLGQRVLLFNRETSGVLAELTTVNVTEKIQRWCVKNHYRCSRITATGRVML